MAGLDKAKVQKLLDLWDLCKESEKKDAVHETAKLSDKIKALGKSNDAKTQKVVAEAFNNHLKVISQKAAFTYNFNQQPLPTMSDMRAEDPKKFLAKHNNKVLIALLDFMDYYRQVTGDDRLGELR